MFFRTPPSVWVGTLGPSLVALFRDRPDVLVAGDHRIYPVEGSLKVRRTADAYVALGRPKGRRRSYKVWEEGGVFPQVVFEIWWPTLRFSQMMRRFAFYQRFGAEELYVIRSGAPAFIEAWQRTTNGRLKAVPRRDAPVSPRLGVRFTVVRGEATGCGVGPDAIVGPA